MATLADVCARYRLDRAFMEGLSRRGVFPADLADEDVRRAAVAAFLREAGLSEEEVAAYFLADDGQRTQRALLRRLRAAALERWHDEAHCVDKLDCLLRSLDEKCAKKAGTYRKKGGHIMEKEIFPVGEENVAYNKYFTGTSYLCPLSKEQVSIAHVTFEPKCRNFWHIHHAEQGGGQILLVTRGRGWYQEWGKPARALQPGDVVNIPAGVKHWHGAASDTWFAHLAVEVPAVGGYTEWCEPVTDEQYKEAEDAR